MRCIDCKYYYDGNLYNRCDLTEMEYFYRQNDCTLVNDDGTINYNDPYFQEQPVCEQDMSPWDMENTGEAVNCNDRD